MRKIVPILIIVMLIAGNIYAQSSSFQEVKQLALTTQLDINGNYFKTIIGLPGIKYAVGYCPDIQTIGVSVQDLEQHLIIIVIYDEEKQIYQAGSFQNNIQLDKQIITQEQADKFANEVLEKFRSKI